MVRALPRLQARNHSHRFWRRSRRHLSARVGIVQSPNQTETGGDLLKYFSNFQVSKAYTKDNLICLGAPLWSII